MLIIRSPNSHISLEEKNCSKCSGVGPKWLTVAKLALHTLKPNGIFLSKVPSRKIE